MAEGVGFEPTTPITQGKRLAGARTRPTMRSLRAGDAPGFTTGDTHFYYSTTPGEPQSWGGGVGRRRNGSCPGKRGNKSRVGRHESFLRLCQEWARGRPPYAPAKEASPLSILNASLGRSETGGKLGRICVERPIPFIPFPRGRGRIGDMGDTPICPRQKCFDSLDSPWGPMPKRDRRCGERPIPFIPLWKYTLGDTPGG